MLWYINIYCVDYGTNRYNIYQTFIDINQCSTNNGGCEQECTDLIPGYECSCYNGYELDTDKHSCTGKLYVYFINFHNGYLVYHGTSFTFRYQ